MLLKSTHLALAYILWKPPDLLIQLHSHKTELQNLLTRFHPRVENLIVRSLWHSTACSLWISQIGKGEIISTRFPHQENSKHTSKLVCPSHTETGCHGLLPSLRHLPLKEEYKIPMKETSTDNKRIINVNRFQHKVILHYSVGFQLIFYLFHFLFLRAKFC